MDELSELEDIGCKEVFRDMRLNDAQTKIMQGQALLTYLGLNRQAKGMKKMGDLDAAVDKLQEIVAASEEIVMDLVNNPTKRGRTATSIMKSHADLVKQASQAIRSHYIEPIRPAMMPQVPQKIQDPVNVTAEEIAQKLLEEADGHNA